MKLPGCLLGLCLSVLLYGCQSTNTVVPPDIEFQDVSLSLSTVNPEANLDLFAYDKRAPLDVKELDRQQLQGITTIDLTYASPTGSRVPTTLILPKGAGPFAGLVIQHGMPSDRKAMDWLGQSYAHMGAVVVMIDAPWARPERQECEGYTCRTVPRFTEEDRTDQIELMIDLQRAVDLLLSRPEVDPQRLAYIGVSYGGAMGGLFAGIEQRLKAYVLVVGDGGLVEHTSEPDESGYPDHWNKRWVEAMWPIEPLHYVSRAAPAALLFQNGLQDDLVPPRDALRYQQAGSQPKTVRWYDAGHGPTASSLSDQSLWLFKHIGPQGLFFLRPYFSASTIWVNYLLGFWFLLVVASLILLLLDTARGTPWTAGTLLSWVLVVLFFGPFGLVSYFFTWRRPLRAEPAKNNLSTAWRALGATSWSVAWVLLGSAAVIVVVVSYLDFFSDAPILNIFFSVGLPFLSAFLIYLVMHLTSMQEGSRFTLRWSPMVLFISVCIVMAGSYPLMILLINRWLGQPYPFGWNLTNALIFGILCLGALSGAVIAYLPHYWMIRRGLLVWSVPAPGDQLEEHPISSPARMPWYQTTGYCLLAFIIMLVGIGLASIYTI